MKRMIVHSHSQFVARLMEGEMRTNVVRVNRGLFRFHVWITQVNREYEQGLTDQIWFLCQKRWPRNYKVIERKDGFTKLSYFLTPADSIFVLISSPRLSKKTTHRPDRKGWSTKRDKIWHQRYGSSCRWEIQTLISRNEGIEHHRTIRPVLRWQFHAMFSRPIQRAKAGSSYGSGLRPDFAHSKRHRKLNKVGTFLMKLTSHKSTRVSPETRQQMIIKTVSFHIQ
jgi:hypothetical protein